MASIAKLNYQFYSNSLLPDEIMADSTEPLTSTIIQSNSPNDNLVLVNGGDAYHIVSNFTKEINQVKLQYIEQYFYNFKIDYLQGFGTN
jgi:hypothetical protein